MKKGAIFDMDGLLFDTERIYCENWEETARRFGRTPDPAFSSAICGTSGAGALEVVLQHYPGVDPQSFVRTCVALTEERLLQGVPEKPGTRDLLAFFRGQGVKLAVASSSKRSMILRNLHQTGLDVFFDSVVSGDDVVRGKPEPDIFLLAAQRLNCAPEDCYVFEDGINGARAGIAAGCTTVMIPDLFQPAEDLYKGCAGIYPSLCAAQRAIEANIL